jgi:hypothetical protein
MWQLPPCIHWKRENQVSTTVNKLQTIPTWYERHPSSPIGRLHPFSSKSNQPSWGPRRGYYCGRNLRTVFTKCDYAWNKSPRLVNFRFMLFQALSIRPFVDFSKFQTREETRFKNSFNRPWCLEWPRSLNGLFLRTRWGSFTKRLHACTFRTMRSTSLCTLNCRPDEIDHFWKCLACRVIV